MTILEVRANLAFRDWRAGEIRAVDGDDQIIAALVFNRYLTVINEVPDEVEMEPVAPKKLRGTRRARKDGTNGQDLAEHASGAFDGTESGNASGAPDSSADLPGS